MLADLGFDVRQVSATGKYDNATVGVVNNPFHRLFRVAIWRISDPHRALIQSSLAWMRHFKPDIIIVERDPDSLIALQAGIARRLFVPNAKLILHSWQNVHRPLSTMAKVVLDQTLRLADLILIANEAGRSVLEKWGYRGQVRKQIWVGVNGDHFSMVEGRTEASQNAFVVGFIGRFVQAKGIIDLLEAIALLPETVSCNLIGKGELEPLLRQKVKELGIQDRVNFIGYVPHLALAKQLTKMDVLVLPSRSTTQWEEQFGRVLIEAMACGTAVIGSSSGAIPEVIADAGIIFREGDTVALAKAIHSLYQSATQHKQIVQRGLQLVKERYSQEVIVDHLATLYRELVEA